jgi:hypothetical protein
MCKNYIPLMNIVRHVAVSYHVRPPACQKNGWYGHIILRCTAASVSTSSSIRSPFGILLPRVRGSTRVYGSHDAP